MARVLIVDDEPIHLKYASLLLESEGYIIEQAASAKEALDMISRNVPDLVLLDFQLPDRNGIAVLKEIRRNDEMRLLPVVMLTASTDRNDKKSAIRAGVTDFMNKPFDANELLARVRSLIELKYFTDELDTAKDVIVTLANTIDARDSYTAGHSFRVSFYSRMLGERIKMTEKDLKNLQQGGLFHDFGKISVQDSVLLKPGKLTPEEYEHVKIHPSEGQRLLCKMKTLTCSLPVVFHHHERLDGSGYPSGLSGNDLSISVRISSIADVYDALTTNRPYRKAFSRQEAIQIMESEAKKGWWDASLLDEFRGVLDKLTEKNLTNIYE